MINIDVHSLKMTCQMVETGRNSSALIVKKKKDKLYKTAEVNLSFIFLPFLIEC